MSDPVESKPREPVLQRLARLGIKQGPGGSRPFRTTRTKRFYRDLDENIFSKRKPTETDKTK